MGVLLFAVVGLTLLFSIPYLPALLNAVFLIGVIVAVVRFFTRGHLPGDRHAGVGMAFFAAMILWPFQVALWLLRGLGKLWLHGRGHRLKLPRDRRSLDRLSSAAQRGAARAANRSARKRPVRYADDDPGFDQWWRDTYGDGPGGLLANVAAIRHP